MLLIGILSQIFCHLVNWYAVEWRPSSPKAFENTLTSTYRYYLPYDTSNIYWGVIPKVIDDSLPVVFSKTTLVTSTFTLKNITTDIKIPQLKNSSWKTYLDLVQQSTSAETVKRRINRKWRWNDWKEERKSNSTLNRHSLLLSPSWKF